MATCAAKVVGDTGARPLLCWSDRGDRSHACSRDSGGRHFALAVTPRMVASGPTTSPAGAAAHGPPREGGTNGCMEALRDSRAPGLMRDWAGLPTQAA